MFAIYRVTPGGAHRIIGLVREARRDEVAYQLELVLSDPLPAGNYIATEVPPARLDEAEAFLRERLMSPAQRELFRLYGNLAGVTARTDDEEEVAHAVYRALLPAVPDLAEPLPRAEVFPARSPDALVERARTLLAELAAPPPQPPKEPG